MVRLRCIDLAFMVVIVDMVLGKIGNGSINSNETLTEIIRRSNKLETRRKNKIRSTSSSSGDKTEKSHDSDETKQSLGITDDSDDTSDMDEERKRKRGQREPKSSVERRGWRKWHRKCPICREDMVKKWRDPSIQWICGAYQRARRSFKSLCMMHYRNCQDGTMFTKIHDHRCNNDSTHGDHFFYDYPVKLSDDSSKTSGSSSSTAELSVESDDY